MNSYVHECGVENNTNCAKYSSRNDCPYKDPRDISKQIGTQRLAGARAIMMVLILVTHFEISYLYSRMPSRSCILKCPPGRNDKPNRILFWQSDPPCGRRPNVCSSICPWVLKNVLYIPITIPLKGNVENVRSGPVLILVDFICNNWENMLPHGIFNPPTENFRHANFFCRENLA